MATDAYALIHALVGFDTTSRDSNLGLIRYVGDYLAGHGIQAELFQNHEGTKANLFATVGAGEVGGVVLSGHTDVVPVDGQDWATDPFRVTERDGRLYGRGTCDMKSFLACALALVPEFQARRLPVPIHLALSYDEEVGCLGAPRMLAPLAARGLSPRAVIVGEPTEMAVVTQHKGIQAFQTVVTGLEAHSSDQERGVNAILYAARLIQFLESLRAEMKARTPVASPFDPPYTTVHVGTIAGGTALNIIPRRCELRWEYRNTPNIDPEELVERVREHCRNTLLPEMRRLSPLCDIVTERTGSVPAFRPEPDSPAATLAMALLGTNATAAVSFGTEAGQFQEAGFPTVVCGPGSIREAHRPNEFIARAQVDACLGFLRRLADHLASG
ncbi:MAG: acetylornithine deacetylase [Alphaproteobacteria bacterium]|nr:acetylornithine deacetylase [Alphaproteobacteria bacterium]